MSKYSTLIILAHAAQKVERYDVAAMCAAELVDNYFQEVPEGLTVGAVLPTENPDKSLLVVTFEDNWLAIPVDIFKSSIIADVISKGLLKGGEAIRRDNWDKWKYDRQRLAVEPLTDLRANAVAQWCCSAAMQLLTPEWELQALRLICDR